MSEVEPAVPIPGSERGPMPGASRIGASDPGAVATVSVVLRPREDLGAIRPRPRLARDEALRRSSADPAAVARAVEFAEARGLEVVDARPEARTVRLRGALGALGPAFGVGFEDHAHPDGDYRAQLGPTSVPAALAGDVLGVLGLDDRRLALHMDGSTKCGLSGSTPVPIVDTKLVPDLVTRYNLPPGDGTGQYIGILCLGGGFTKPDATTWFTDHGLPKPDITWKGVDGGKNRPSPGEPVLDIHVTGSVAPGAKIVAYFAPGSSQGLHDALTEAVSDGATVLSLSYAHDEGHWTASERASIDAAITAAAAAGVTFCVASGDCGATRVYYPGSSPDALACGGTMIAEGQGGDIEQVWNNTIGDQGWMASSGGVCALYPVPSYQSDNGIEPVSIITKKADGASRMSPGRPRGSSWPAAATWSARASAPPSRPPSSPGSSRH